jgi:drug/metabolite transporter (DMT)-like permease
MGVTMSLAAAILWLINLLLDTTGHLCLKAASMHAHGTADTRYWRRLSRQPALWGGLAAFACEFVAWLAFLTLVPLSTAVMVSCLNMAGVAIGGRLFLQEVITPPRALAVILIVCGVGLVAWGTA